MKRTKKEEPCVEVKPQENFHCCKAILGHFKEQTGINFYSKEDITREKLINFCRHREIYDFEEFFKRLKTYNPLWQELVNFLTVNETYFFREYPQIKLLVDFVQNSTEKVRILCAPCSTGEEVYSIVIALTHADISKDKYEILGIDINSEAIDKAKTALYRKRALNRLEPEYVDRYFCAQGDEFKLSSEITSKPQFQVVNIFDANFIKQQKFDFVFSRNMLIYFEKEVKERAMKIFSQLVKENGKIFLGHADLPPVIEELKPSMQQGIKYYELNKPAEYMI